MYFENTASVTRVGALLEKKKLGTNLISLHCRHPIMELIVSKMFETLMGPSSRPNIKLIQRFVNIGLQLTSVATKVDWMQI